MTSTVEMLRELRTPPIHDLTYDEFVSRKATFDQSYGHVVDASWVNPILKPHQRDLVLWAVAGGRRAIFAAFGLGKSVMQIEVLRITLAMEHATKGGVHRGLIVCPLGVKTEFEHDAAMLGQEVRFIRRTEQVDPEWGGIYLTNYESIRDGRLDPTVFTAVSLDEASVLRSYGSKTFQTFLALFAPVPYRFVATATPSPNRYKELIHYAGFLGVMDTGQALTRFFQRDSTQANNLTIYPHKEREFWLWLNTWAAFLQSPGDLGYDATGYDLPPLEVHWHQVDVDHALAGEERDGQGLLYRGGAMDLQGASKEKRRTLTDRVAALTEIVKEHRDRRRCDECALPHDLRLIDVTGAACPSCGRETPEALYEPGDQIVIWCHLNDEQAAIEKALTNMGANFSSVHGGLDVDENETRLAAWKNRQTYALIGKPVMLGQGMNLQQASVCVFVGIDHKFNDFGQALHRIQRFGQTRHCHAHVIYAESETEIRADLMDKWTRHKELTATMTDVIREHGLSTDAINEALRRAMGVDRIAASGENWHVANNDCVVETRDHMADNSVDLIVTSIPFANHYEYTPNYNDFGHTDDNAHFWAQMDYLTPQLHRVLAPGRIYACHVKDRINFGNVTGAGIPTVSPFHVEAILHGQRHGFDYLGMITVVTDVVRENNQTYRLSWSEQCKDATKMGVGSPEYILLFHKPQSDRSRGYADTPVTKDKAIESDPDIESYTRARWQIDAHAFWRSSGDRLLTPEELVALPVEQRSRLFTRQTLNQVYDYESHVKVGEILDGRGALPATFMSLAPGSSDPYVWHDVNRMLTLNGDQRQRNLTMHVCPLQIDIVDRLIYRFSNPGDTVYDPFGGLMTVPYRALNLGRKGRASELNSGYFLDGVKYLESAERELGMPSLFDLLDDAS
jgi:hypothetical protein